ncbi:MAG TPA: CcdB family protein [Sphingomonas sp.]|jgi:hypothetical protein
MAQFDVYWLNDGYVVDVQSNLIDYFGSRLVVPLLPLEGAPPSIARLMPELEVEGSKQILATPMASAVRRTLLGKPVGSLIKEEYAIKAALDVLITGS